MRIWVKVCGIRTAAAARAVAAAGADAAGFVFAPSRRQVTPEVARELVWHLPPSLEKVGVFVNRPAREVERIALACKLDWLQFHGEEEPYYCRYFAGRWKVIKAFPIAGRESLQKLDHYQVDAYLLDTCSPLARGGTGKTFNWELVRGLKLPGRLVLAGGLHPGNIVQALETVRPAGVDVSSGVETAGEKDPAKLNAFINAIRRWENASTETPR